MELQNKLEELNLKKKKINLEIAKQTELLQKQLKEVESEIKTIKKEILNQEKLKVNDKSVHILERFIIWNGLKHDNVRWLIKHGPIRDSFFDDCNRYRTYSIVERLNDYLSEYVYDNFDDEDLPETEDPYDFSLASEEGIRFFDEKLDDSQKQEITALIENAIEMNIDEFTCDC